MAGQDREGQGRTGQSKVRQGKARQGRISYRRGDGDGGGVRGAKGEEKMYTCTRLW
jgi:hypothetical protein